MVQGESSKDKTYWEIQRFLCDNGPATSKEIFENCTCAKATFYKYLDELYGTGDIICNPQRGRGEDIYELSEKTCDKIKEKVLKQKIKDEIDRLPAKQIKSLYDLIDKILMKSVGLTCDTVFLENLLQGLLEGKISKEKIGEVKKKYAEQKKAMFTQRSYFFTQKEIDQMSVHELFLSEEESEIISKERIKWFEKWFGTQI